jgi:hypothetical protein
MRRFIFWSVCVAILLGALAVWAKTRYLTEAGDLRHMTIPIGLTETQKGGTAPTKASKGTTPTVQGLLFDANDELMQLQVHVPDQYEEGTDIEVNLYVALNQLETIGDDIDWTADYVVVTPSVDAVTKTSTNVTSDTTVVSGGTADGTLYKCVITLDDADANNPIDKEDLIIMEIHRTDLADVGGVILIEADAHVRPEL